MPAPAPWPAAPFVSPSQAVPRTERLLTGPGETADFEVRAEAAGALRLELDSPFAPWRLEVPVLVRP